MMRQSKRMSDGRKTQRPRLRNQLIAVAVGIALGLVLLFLTYH